MVSDSELVTRLREILRSSDLNTATAGSIRRQLEEEFGVSLNDKRVFIREQIDVFIHAHFSEPQNEKEDEEEEDDGNEEQEEENENDKKEDNDEAQSEVDEEEEQEVDESDEEGSKKKRYFKISYSMCLIYFS